MLLCTHSKTCQLCNSFYHFMALFQKLLMSEPFSKRFFHNERLGFFRQSPLCLVAGRAGRLLRSRGVTQEALSSLLPRPAYVFGINLFRVHSRSKRSIQNWGGRKAERLLSKTGQDGLNSLNLAIQRPRECIIFTLYVHQPREGQTS